MELDLKIKNRELRNLDPDPWSKKYVSESAELQISSNLIQLPFYSQNFLLEAWNIVAIKLLLSVPKCTANMYCICLSIDLWYTKADVVQICGKFWDTQYTIWYGRIPTLWSKTRITPFQMEVLDLEAPETHLSRDPHGGITIMMSQRTLKNYRNSPKGPKL